MEIVKWAETFEHKTVSKRPNKGCTWYAHPVDLNSDGLVEMMSMGSDGLCAIAIFNLLCQWTAGKDLEKRGSLTDKHGEPISYERWARLFRQKPATIQRAFVILADAGWISTGPDPDPMGPTLDPMGAVPDPLGAVPVRTRTQKEPTLQDTTDRTGQDKTEQDKTDKKSPSARSSILESSFEEFWAAYPKGRKVGKRSAKQSFAKAIKDTDPAIIIQAAKEYAESDVAQGQYLKGPTPWLNGGCWEDDRTAWEDRPEKPKPRPVTFEEQKQINTIETYNKLIEMGDPFAQPENPNPQRRIEE